MKSKEAKNRIVPKLRFPEFRDAERWEENALDNLGKFTGGGTPSKDNNSYWEGTIPWISSSDIFEDSIYHINISRFISEEALERSATKYVPENSILLVSRVGVGKLAVSAQPICTSQDFTNFTPNKDNLFFLAYYLKFHSKILLEYCQGMAIKGFTKDDISKLNLFLPSLEEQQKIADCLSSIDELISATGDKIEVLKAHKKSLMQQLFPAEGETMPKLRFPEFRDVREWKIKKLGKVAELIDERARTNEYISMSVISGVGLVSQKEKFGREIAGSQYKNYFVIRKWDFAYNKSATKQYPEGYISMLKNIEVAAVPNSIFTCFHIDNKKILPQFLDYLFHDNFHGKWLRKFIEIGSRAHGSLNVDTNVLFSMPVIFPSFSEQQKIADCLSSIDDIISAQSQKLEALKACKKGLMQQLFPSIDNIRSEHHA